jgi:16S rRNA (guanine966-N2)-methyltransferase
MFSALDSRLGGFDDLVVLDLFAGSGALGIEALSRGAAQVLFVDRDRSAVDAVGANLATTKLAGQARVVQADAMAVVGGPPPAEAPFDLVFLDPPYDVAAGTVGGVLRALALAAWTSPGALAVVEQAWDASTTVGDGWRSEWERRYGATLVVFAERDESEG